MKIDIFHHVKVMIKHSGEMKAPKCITATTLLYELPISNMTAELIIERSITQLLVQNFLFVILSVHDCSFSNMIDGLLLQSTCSNSTLLFMWRAQTSICEILFMFCFFFLSLLLRIQTKFSVRLKHCVIKFGSRCFSLLKIYIVQSHTLYQSCQWFCHAANIIQETKTSAKTYWVLLCIHIWFAIKVRNFSMSFTFCAELRCEMTTIEYIHSWCAIRTILLLIYMQVMFKI